jgi:predicted HicB family RNase H-like nuclease
MVEYKGYSGTFDVDLEDGVISGRVLGIRDVVTFEGETVAKTVQAFRDSVDDYLDFCAQTGTAPDKPFSGKFVVRIRPELHRALAITSEARGMSLNAYVEESLAAHLPSEVSPAAAPAGFPAARRAGTIAAQHAGKRAGAQAAVPAGRRRGKATHSKTKKGKAG